MRRKTVWRALGAGLVAGTAYAVWRAVDANRRSPELGWEPQPFPFPPQPRVDASTGGPTDATTDASSAASKGPAWVAPDEGTCPASYPIKAKLTSGIYHQPGGLSYERTRPDRCYRDGAAAEADGLRAAKR
jgi:hypothetical protein